MIYVALASKVDTDIVSFIAFVPNLINIADRKIYIIGNLKENDNLPYIDGSFKNNENYQLKMLKNCVCN